MISESFFHAIHSSHCWVTPYAAVLRIAFYDNDMLLDLKNRLIKVCLPNEDKKNIF